MFTVIDPLFPPAHDILLGVVPSDIDGKSVTVTGLLLTHPLASVPVIVYVVVAEGVAVTADPVVVFNPAAGDQV